MSAHSRPSVRGQRPIPSGLRQALAWICGCLSFLAQGGDPAGPPAILAIEPPSLVAGTTNVVKIRGLRLDSAAIRFDGPGGGLLVEVRDRKKAEIPPGLEAKEAGDARLEAVVSVPGDFARATVNLRASTAAGESGTRPMRVVPPDSFVAEKEPNGGFREAQTLEPGRTVRGRIQPDKDVDVFRWMGVPGRRYRLEVFAARGGSLLDAVLWLHDGNGRLLATNDDADGRDPRLDYECKLAGPLFVSILDAQDRGGEWHGYELTLTEAP